MSRHGLWVLQQSVEGYTHISNYFGYDQSNRIVNERLIKDEEIELRYRRGSMAIAGDPVLPNGFPRPILSLPPLDFDLDFFTQSGMIFVSRRFRDALAQPPGVVQYWPVDLVRASDEAHGQDYMLLRILASEPAMDLGRSVYNESQSTNRRTGEVLTWRDAVNRIVPIEGIVSRTEIFRVEEDKFTILVTDALAERVLRAGCDGVSFDEPETIGMHGREAQRRRTADGIIVKDADLPRWEETLARQDRARLTGT